MRLIKHPRIAPVLLTVGSWILRAILWLSIRTLRLEVVAGREHLQAFYADPRPVVLSFWHNRVFLAARFVLRDLFRENIEVTVLAGSVWNAPVSPSRIGQPFQVVEPGARSKPTKPAPVSPNVRIAKRSLPMTGRLLWSDVV